MIEWLDNQRYELTTDVTDMLPYANRPISSILTEKGNDLLIFPLSFQRCKDKIEEQHLFDIIPNKNKYLVYTGNLAGFISINGMHIAIHSRFSKGNMKEDYFLHYMLQKVLSINVFNMKHSIAEEQILDFMLYLFPYYINDALSQGLYKEYQRNSYNDCNVRGPIDINRHIRKNMPFSGRIAYNTREFSHDNSLTQLIRHTIEYIKTKRNGEILLHNDAETQANVSKIILATSKYRKQDRMQIIQKNIKPVNHPYFTKYIPLQRLCLRILRHEKLKFGHDNKDIYGILFDVSWLWEEYLATMLKPIGFIHPDNRHKRNGIWLGYNENHKKNSFLRYPDFYDKDSDGTIIDAKYKREIDHVEDINQVITYMYRLKGQNGIFIQPTNGKSCSIPFILYGYGDNTRIIKYLFQIPTDSSDYKEFCEGMKQSEKSFQNMILQTTKQ